MFCSLTLSPPVIFEASTTVGRRAWLGLSLAWLGLGLAWLGLGLAWLGLGLA
jgi:hypothetical protein